MQSFKKLQAAVIISLVIAGAPITSAAAWSDFLGDSIRNTPNDTTVTGGPTGVQVNGKTAGSEGGPSFKQVAGTVGGGVVGAALGNQVGSGSGRTIATVIGGAVGALIGNQLTKEKPTDTTSYIYHRDGTKYANGSNEMDPINELPNYKLAVKRVQKDYVDFMVSRVNLASSQKAIVEKGGSLAAPESQKSLFNVDQETKSLAIKFESSLASLNATTETMAKIHDKKIDETSIAILSSCNTVKAENYNTFVSHAELMREAGLCEAKSPTPS